MEGLRGLLANSYLICSMLKGPAPSTATRDENACCRTKPAHIKGHTFIRYRILTN